jgi:hypothetical protein
MNIEEAFKAMADREMAMVQAQRDLERQREADKAARSKESRQAAKDIGELLGAASMR